LHSRLRKFILLAVLLPAFSLCPSGFGHPFFKGQKRDGDIITYIHSAWHTLRRSMDDCSAFADVKLGSGTAPVLYIPAGDSVKQSSENYAKKCGIKVVSLPRKITRLGEISPDKLPVPGLLYLPNAYVVPGGRFNEMYGWDSYFILRGLLEEGDRETARGMVENFFFEIENYGAILNANRTYYLTRSQPPLLTSMILAVYEADTKAGKADSQWLEKAYGYAKRDHKLWTTAPKLDTKTQLSRYFDVGNGPVPEVADHPDDYISVADWIVKHPQSGADYIAKSNTDSSAAGPEIQVPRCGTAACPNSRKVRLTSDYYKGDRAMRESGFDITFRFGPFGGRTHHFAPVCLNSLLYKEEVDLETMARQLGHTQEAKDWHWESTLRRSLVTRYLWNIRAGLFTDLDLEQHKASDYHYAATFYPLWSGLATAQQAKTVMGNLKMFEQPGGIAMSDRESGVQWDKPYGWAPIQMLAVEGMRRYGFNQDADRISKEFLSMVKENFQRDKTIREKYNVVRRTTEVDVSAGYSANVIGFGWTNGTYLVLLHELPKNQQAGLE